AARALAETSDDDLMRIQVLMGEAKYAQALAMAKRLVHDLPADDEHAAEAFLVSNLGAVSAAILQRPADFTSDLVSKWITSGPHDVIDGVIPFNSLLAACCLSPKAIGKKCFDRLQQLRTDGKLPTIFAGSDVAVNGGAFFVAEDYAGAAKSWRTLLRAPGW